MITSDSLGAVEDASLSCAKLVCLIAIAAPLACGQSVPNALPTSGDVFCIGDRGGKTIWKSWDNGGKLILVSAGFCLLSLFLPWLGDLLGESRRLTDMPVGSPLFLVVLYGGPLIYPVTTIWTGRVLRKGWGIVCATFGLVLCVSLGAGMRGPLPELYQLLGGYYVYLLSMLGLAAGVLLHGRTSELLERAERSALPNDPTNSKRT